MCPWHSRPGNSGAGWKGDTGTRLLTPTGNLTIGPGDAPAVQGFLASARRYDIPHEY
jgi:hypothetical protein